MHHGTCVTHVPWCMPGSLTHRSGENVPGIPSACATLNFTYLAKGPWRKFLYLYPTIPKEALHNPYSKIEVFHQIHFIATLPKCPSFFFELIFQTTWFITISWKRRRPVILLLFYLPILSFWTLVLHWTGLVANRMSFSYPGFQNVRKQEWLQRLSKVLKLTVAPPMSFTWWRFPPVAIEHTARPMLVTPQGWVL